MTRKLYTLFFLISFSCSTMYAQTVDELVTQIKANDESIDVLLQDASKHKNKLQELYAENQKLKLELVQIGSDLNNPVYFTNDVYIDENLDLVDFYIYPTIINNYQIFGKLKNKQDKNLNNVKIRYNLYKNGDFVWTDYGFNFFDTYGMSGISAYNTGLIMDFIDMVEFDSIAIQVEYNSDDRMIYYLWDQLLTIEDMAITPGIGGMLTLQGVAKNPYNYTVELSALYTEIYKNGRMVAINLTPLGDSDSGFIFQANSFQEFDSMIELPEGNVDIKYNVSYNLGSITGSGNLPPNRPIFTADTLNGQTGQSVTLEAFVIDPNDDSISLALNYGNGDSTGWQGEYPSNSIASIDHIFDAPGQYIVKAKAGDDSLSSTWSDSIIVNIQDATQIESKAQPVQFHLSDAYPNPFNPTTKIRTDLPAAEKAVISIFDITGKEIVQLYNGRLSAGTHVINWNAVTAPSGIYFIRYQSDVREKIVKCTLLK